MQSTPEAGQLVRSYSIELENNLPSTVPANDLRRIFIDNERRIRREEENSTKWRAFYEPWEPTDENTDPTTRVARDQAVLLSHAWKLFRTSISKSEQEELEGIIPSIEGLVGMVHVVAKQWHDNRASSKTGKYMKYFTGFCETLEAHSSMLEILPDGNEYVSLFTGTLKTIINAADLIQASSNYEKIASGLGRALSQISIHIVACEKEVRLYRTKAMQEKIALLYAHVFLFLEDTMAWYLKKPRLKLRDAFRENFYEQFEEMIVNIQDLSRDILREANLSSMAETRLIGLTTDRTLEELRLGQFDARLSAEGVRREQAEVKHQIEQLRLDMQSYREERRQLELNGPQWIEEFRNSLFSQIASGVRQELLGVAQKALDERRLIASGQTQRPMGYVESPDGSLTELHLYERDTIIVNSNHLLDIFSPNHIKSPYQSPYGTPFFLETYAASRLREWTTDPGANFLSIAGRRPKGLEPPPMTVLATMCIDFATNSKLPAISYFCALPSNDELRTGNTREVQALLSLTYALIRQLIENLPIQFSSEFDLSKERLSRLDGTLESWKNATCLLRDLIDAVPKPLFCIIDGFQVLDDWSTEAFTADFSKALRGSTTKEFEKEMMKVLINSTGRSRALMKSLEVKELVFADRDGAVDSPARRGGKGRLIL